jgi:hypothetical protein
MRRLRISPLAAGGLLFLIGVNATFAFWIFHSLSSDSAVEISTGAWVPEANAALTDIAGPSAPNAYPETLARPIFFRDRRPYVPPPPPPPPVQPAPVFVAPSPVTKPDLVVSGIALIGDAKQAYLGYPPNPDGIWVKEGEDVMGWQVSSITSAGVTISRAGQSIDLLLYEPVAQE